MGAWGPGGLENDAALDFAAAVRSVDDLVCAFAARPGEKIDADTASMIIAAAECVAAMLDRPADDIPKDLAVRLCGFGRPEAALLDATRNHVSMVISHSELSELWAEANNPGEFNLAMTGLIDRLNPDIKPKAKKAKKGRKEEPQFSPSPCAFCNKPMGKAEFGMFDLSVDLGNGVPSGSASGRTSLASIAGSIPRTRQFRPRPSGYSAKASKVIDWRRVLLT